MNLYRKFALLNSKIIECRRCPRLIEHMEEVAEKKVRRYAHWNYWAKPLPGLGDLEAKLLIIGLAPASHGGCRTGRMFTGDSSGDWLIKALYECGFANQPLSVSREDGLRLTSAYVTAVVRCAPPSNRPNREEIENCSEYLAEELRLLHNVKVVLTLGRVAFNAYLRHMSSRASPLKLRFKHGAIHKLGEGLPILVSSYHPSRQNTQTGKLRWEAWIDVFRKIRCLLENPSEAEGLVKQADYEVKDVSRAIRPEALQ